MTGIWEEDNYSIRRTHHISIPIYDRYILIHGGHSFENKHIKSCDPFTIYDTETKTESKPIFKNSISIPSLMYHSWCFTNEEHTQVLIYGGCEVESKELIRVNYIININSNGLDKSNDNTIHLEVIPLDSLPKSPTPYIFSTLTYYPDLNCCVLIGGCELDYKTFNNSIWIFTYENNSYNWIEIVPKEEDSIFTPKWGHVAEYINGKIYIFGGFTCLNTTYSDTNELDEITIMNNNNTFNYDCSINVIGSINPDVRRGHCSVCFNNSIYVFGGFNNNIFYNDLWLFGNNNKKKKIKSEKVLELIEYERKNQIMNDNLYEEIDDDDIINILEKEKIRYDMISSLTDDDLFKLADKYNKELKDLKYALQMENKTLYKYDLLFENEEIYEYVKENDYPIERAQDILKNMKILGLSLDLDLFKEYFTDKRNLKRIEKSEKELIYLNKRLEKMKRMSCSKCGSSIISYCTIPCGCYYYCEKCANDLIGKVYIYYLLLNNHRNVLFAIMMLKVY